MTARTELSFGYDRNMKPISGYCTRCGEMMPKPPLDLQSSADIIYWLSQQFLEHKKPKHPQPDKEETE